MKLINIFKKEPYPCFKEEWNNPENTVFREFYLTCSVDYDILYRLVKENMSDKGNEGVDKSRLLALLKAEGHRSFYLSYQRRKYPYTYLIRWYIRQISNYIHRKIKSKKFKMQVELCEISSNVAKKLSANIHST